MIHIVEYINTDLKHMDHWRTVVPHGIEMAGFDVNVIGKYSPTVYHRDWNLLGEIYYKTIQFQKLYESFALGEISPGDTIIFGDAWNPTAMSVKYIELLIEHNITLVGFWRDGIYNVSSKIRNGLFRKPKKWAQSFERGLYGAFDHNCFITQDHKERFLRRYHLVDGEKVHVVGLPYEYITELRKQYKPVEKENIIVFPHDAIDEDQRNIIKALTNQFPDYTFIDCYELKLDNSEYYSLLNRAKAIMAFNLSETDPTNIYEGMLFGCVPIIPDRLIYKDIFPDKYQYPSHYTEPPFLNFVRGREYMHDCVHNVIKNYNDLSRDLKKESSEIGQKIFSNQRLISLLKTINKNDESKSIRRRRKHILARNRFKTR